MVIMNWLRDVELLHSVKDIKRPTPCAEGVAAWAIINKITPVLLAGTQLLAPVNTDGRRRSSSARELAPVVWDISKPSPESSRIKSRDSRNELDQIHIFKLLSHISIRASGTVDFLPLQLACVRQRPRQHLMRELIVVLVLQRLVVIADRLVDLIVQMINKP